MSTDIKTLQFGDHVDLVRLLNTADGKKHSLQQLAVGEIDYVVNGELRTAKNVVTQFDQVYADGELGSVPIPGVYKVRVHFFDKDDGCDMHEFHGDLNLNLMYMRVGLFTNRNLRCQLDLKGYRLKVFCVKAETMNPVESNFIQKFL